jgi:Xaa-Pro aminopeptidase
VRSGILAISTGGWKRQWRETKTGDFPGKLSAIVKELKREAATIALLVEEGERKAEIERQEWEARQIIWRREEEERRRIKAEKDSREELFEIIEAWVEAKRIEEFFADAEQRAAELGDEEKSILQERLKLAREMIGGTDALKWFRSWKTPDER